MATLYEQCLLALDSMPVPYLAAASWKPDQASSHKKNSFTATMCRSVELELLFVLKTKTLIEKKEGKKQNEDT